MLQFYFLSVLLNVITGLILVFTPTLSKSEPKTQPFFETNHFRLVLGILATFTGVMKLLSVVQYDIPVVGDLLPALAGVLGGFCMLFEYYTCTTSLDVKVNTFFETIFIRGRKYVGIFCIFVGTMHFIFPRVLFL
jgi:hypothetical protein